MGESDLGSGLSFVLAPRGRQRRQVMGVFGWRMALVFVVKKSGEKPVAAATIAPLVGFFERSDGAAGCVFRAPRPKAAPWGEGNRIPVDGFRVYFEKKRFE
jgi:hypothetical protein